MPDGEAKLKGLEISAAWLNEAREIPWPIVAFVLGRVGRYPAKRDGGASWSGVIMDTNPPDTDHWLYQRFEEERPAGWRLFKQPGGLVWTARLGRPIQRPRTWRTCLLATTSAPWPARVPTG